MDLGLRWKGSSLRVWGKNLSPDMHVWSVKFRTRDRSTRAYRRRWSSSSISVGGDSSLSLSLSLSFIIHLIVSLHPKHRIKEAPAEMSNRLIRLVPSRTAAGSSFCGSRRIRSTRVAVSKRSSQTHTAKCTLLRGLSRRTYVNVVYPIMLDTTDRSRTLPDAAGCSPTQPSSHN